MFGLFCCFVWSSVLKNILVNVLPIFLTHLLQIPPPPLKIQALLERTGYTLDVTTGQRKYGGPPPDTVYSGSQPGIGTEVGLLNEHLESCYLR